MQTILELQNVVKNYGRTPVLGGVSMEVKEGEIISVLGPSGCGKSTLLRIIAGILPLDQGLVRIRGREVSDKRRTLPPEKRGINMVFQDFALWPHMKVEDNITYGLKVGKVDPAECRKRVEEIAGLLHLDGLMSRYPAELSGGQQQRVAIARALVTKPSILLLDEPLCNLDVQLRIEMRTEMAYLFHKLKTTVFHVTHDPSEAFAMADRIIIMNRGRIDQADKPRTCYLRPGTALVAGLLGMKPDDLGIPESFEIAANRGLSFHFHVENLRDAHPNTAVIEAESADGRKLTLQAASTGGGRIRVDRLDGVEVDFTGDFNTLVVRHQDVAGELSRILNELSVSGVNIANMRLCRDRRGGDALTVVETDQRIPADALRRMGMLYGVMTTTYYEKEED